MIGAPMARRFQHRGVKQAIAVRGDLGMGEGKLAAQVAHASLTAYEHASQGARDAWKRSGQKKIVVRVDDEATVHALNEQAATAGLPTGLVRDAGHTQLAPGTVTAVAIGPAADAEVDDITGDLPLY